MFTRSIGLAIALTAISGGLASAAPETITVIMNPLNQSTESGTAVLTQANDGVKVVVKLKNAADKEEPTHIHLGTCGNINKSPEYSLVDIKDGESVTVVPGISIAQLLKMHYAVNVHKSLKEISTHYSLIKCETAALIAASWPSPTNVYRSLPLRSKSSCVGHALTL
ncbi:MAG: hypothetical protein NVSMB31_18100 [Vulcanimicrobiaceae bacterium]